jgi:hypothetical protein
MELRISSLVPWNIASILKSIRLQRDTGKFLYQMFAVFEEELMVWCETEHWPVSVYMLPFGCLRFIMSKWVPHQECWDDEWSTVYYNLVYSRKWDQVKLIHYLEFCFKKGS